MKLARASRLTAWIAMFAILLAALAPSVARALSSPQQQAMPWSDICAVAGTQAVHDAAPLSGSGQDNGAAFGHCPFCLSHAGQFVLPTAALYCLPAADASAGFFTPSAAAPSPRFVRASAQPRAPPAAS